MKSLPFDQEADSVSGDHLINSRRFCQVSFFFFTDTPPFPLGREVYASRGLLWGVYDRSMDGSSRVEAR